MTHGHKAKVDQLCWNPESPLRLQGIPQRRGDSIIDLLNSEALQSAEDGMVVGVRKVGPVDELLNEHLREGNVRGSGAHPDNYEPLQEVVVVVGDDGIKYSAEENSTRPTGKIERRLVVRRKLPI